MMSPRGRAVVCWYVLLSAIAASGHAEELTVSARAGELRASRADGRLVWKARFPGTAVPSWSPVPGGTLVVNNGAIIDTFGAVVALGHGSSPDHTLRRDCVRDGSCPYWSELANLAQKPAALCHWPLFDSEENAWLLLRADEGQGPLLQVRRSDGHSGAWQPAETIAETAAFGTAATIDGNDNITVLFRTVEAAYNLYAVRYEPGTGWLEPELVYATSSFFQEIEAAADHTGNVVAALDLQEGVWSTVYDAARGVWSQPEQVSAPAWQCRIPTVVRNDSGDAVYLIYWVRAGGPPGLYAHRFDSRTKTWGPAQPLPDSVSVSDSAGGGARFPAVVDAFGEATVFWQTASPEGIYASRTQAGAWLPAHELLPRKPRGASICNLGHADVSEFGDVLGAVMCAEGDQRLYVFRYRSGTGWDEPDNPYTVDLDPTTRVRISFCIGANAIVTFHGRQDGIVQLTSMEYDGFGWSGELLDIPGGFAAPIRELEADRGEPLLVFSTQGIWASWLRTLPGDLDGDGVVGQSDLDILLDAWGGDAGGDIDGDGDTDQADLGILLAHWGETCP